MDNNNNKQLALLWCFLVLVGGILAIPVLSGFYVVVDAGHVGVLKSMGAVNTSELSPGFHFKRPFIDEVVQLDTRLKSFEVRAAAASKDLQTVETTISVQHNIAPVMAAECYQTVGDLDKVDLTVVAPAVQESLKAITAKLKSLSPSVRPSSNWSPMPSRVISTILSARKSWKVR